MSSYVNKNNARFNQKRMYLKFNSLKKHIKFLMRNKTYKYYFNDDEIKNQAIKDI